MTITDVATRAGVHASTVSRTLSHPDKVAPETRRKVQQIVDELGFVPNRAAQGLITGRTGNLAVIVPDITNPHFAGILRGAAGAARERDYQLLLVDTGEHPEEEVEAARSLSPQVDGFVVASPRRLHRTLDALGSIPAVFINRPVKAHHSVLLRTAVALAEALDHLGKLGHRRVAYVGGPTGSWAAIERRDALRKSASERGIELLETGPHEPTFESGLAVANALATSGATAVLAFNDQMALGVMAQFTAMGIAVPGDMSVVGCDDVPIAAMVAPSLTTLHLPAADAGRAAVVHLLDNSGVNGTTSLAAHLVVRGSTQRIGVRSLRDA